ncbi:N-acetyltransferase [Marinobacter algicola]|uniref:N-acetyltransferase domain-containing protein n=1 Tax=Marinobacter algicola DG893 TaxID=443152 RepID=A6EWZ3_9GAMM|nr:N-acetyltransferase [Marinobacter algicola]EDM49007.1 hypothetical protein MDG893_06219 [Marinobacter algicola DG893]
MSMDTLFPSTFKKRWLRPIKQWVYRLFEVKSGILLSQSVVDVSVSEATRDNAPPHITEARGMESGLPVSSEEFQRRTRQGNRLYQMHLDNQLVSWGWVAGAGSRIGVLHDLYLTVPEGALYIWDCVTIPEYRGRGCFPRLLEGILCANRPTSTLALVAVDVRNGASRRALVKAGFRPGFTYISVRTLGLGLFSIAFKGRNVGRAQPWFDAIGQ